VQLLLSGDARINLDNNGRVIDWSRGTFGMALKIECASGPVALKLPNMSGRVELELPLLSTLLEQERDAVSDIVARDPVASHELFCRVQGTGSHEKALSDELLICFGRDSEPPRVSSMAHWLASKNADLKLQRVDGFKTGQMHLPSCGGSGNVTCGSVLGNKNELGEHWYVGLPGVQFEWATTSLAHALDTGSLTLWGVREYTTLLRRLMSGLMILHDASRVHGDLQLDHVMSRGSASDPHSYFLCEFASVNSTASTSSSRGEGYVQLIPRIRESALYPAIRRARRTLEESEFCIERLGPRNSSSLYMVERRHSAERGAENASLLGSTLLLQDIAVQVLARGTQHRRGKPGSYLCQIAERRGERLAVVTNSVSSGHRINCTSVDVIASRRPCEDIYAIGVITIQCLRGNSACDRALVSLLEYLEARCASLPDHWRTFSINEMQEFFESDMLSQESDFLHQIMGGRPWVRSLFLFAVFCLKEGANTSIDLPSQYETEAARAQSNRLIRLMAYLDGLTGSTVLN